MITRDDDLDAILAFVKPDWHARAACRGRRDVNFFPDSGENPRPALAVCATCPVVDPCRDAALDRGEPGIWGATTGRARRKLRRPTSDLDVAA